MKRQMRRDLHREMLVPALYIETPTATPIPCTVRLHTKTSVFGDLAGSHDAHQIEITPKAIFWLTEIAKPKRNAVISVEPGEAYRLDTPQPEDDEFVSVNIVKLDAAECAGLPVPADE